MYIVHLGRQLMDAALGLVFPPQCASCGLPGLEFCHRCAQRVQPLPESICLRCGSPQRVTVALCHSCRNRSRSLTFSRAAALHTEPLRQAIHALKYQERPQLAESLGRYLVAAYQQPPWSELPNLVDAVVPVPLHVERYAERGYNQSELLAGKLCRECNLPLRPHWITRIRPTRQQVGLSPAERRANVTGAFESSAEVRGGTLLLVDDVYTTGSTLEACAEAAVRGGASAVYALTLAVPSHVSG